MTLRGRKDHQLSVQNGEQVPQLVLQPRGSRKDKGEENFKHSIVRGIRLRDIAAELGPDLAALTALYPDGVGRFWGSTPTSQVNNYKARALRDRRVGDEVLFYAEKAFIARARILHLMHNPAAAKWIWGAAEDGQTWEHMVALGDIERLKRPIPAAPILHQLGLGVPLRSITLVGPAEYGALAPMLAEAGILPRRPASITTPPRTLNGKRLFKALERLADACRRDDEDPAARRLPLTVLWHIGQIAIAQGRPAEPPHPGSRLESILQQYGAEPSSDLRTSGLWEVVSRGELWEVDPSAFHAGRASGTRAVGEVSLTPAATALFGDSETRGRAVAVLSTALPDDIDRAKFLAEVGLAGYDSAAGVLDDEETVRPEPGDQGPARRRKVSIDRIIRSSAVAEKVKRLHRHRCQVCDIRLVTRRGFYSEAAHIRGLGRPHEGLDQIDNMLCLCPNHHVQFDGFAIFVDNDLVVRWTADGKKIGKLRLHAEHPIGRENLRHHRRFCGRAD
ncbi:HNH endonuclease [Micromonospora wenchangensis]